MKRLSSDEEDEVNSDEEDEDNDSLSETASKYVAGE